jgi:hypothetical protein
LPELERCFPGLGPDAGIAARFEWTALADRRQSGTQARASLELEVNTEPTVPKRVRPALLPVLFHGAWQGSEEAVGDLLRWATTLWPGNHEGTFAVGASRLEISVDYADAMDREFAVYLDPIGEPWTELRPMACLALALGLAAEDGTLRRHAQDALVAAIGHGRVHAGALGPTLSRLLDTGHNKLARWSKSLGAVAQISPRHAVVVRELLMEMLRGQPARAPRDLGTLLELLVEIRASTDASPLPECVRSYLEGLSAGGKVQRLARQLLAGPAPA